jgi:hypothetical protein
MTIGIGSFSKFAGLKFQKSKIMEFKCFDCYMVFEAEGVKAEYIDPVYGPCSKMVAICPVCGSECSEYRKPKPSRNQGSKENSCPSYHNGSCSCCN